MYIPDDMGKMKQADTFEQCDALLNGARILRARYKGYSPTNPALLNLTAYIDRLLERRWQLSALANRNLDQLFASRNGQANS